MIRSSAFRLILVATLVFFWMALPSFKLCIAQTENEQRNVLPLSPACAPVPGKTTHIMVHKTVRWQGEQYPAAEGTRVLMQVITDPTTDPSLRPKALKVLGRLRNMDTTPRLVSLYGDLHERQEKMGIISCVAQSEDPRGLPFFARILDQERDNAVRLYAAAALAGWNVRRGVRELIDLLECRERLSNGVSIGEGVKIIFRGGDNRLKQWGFPEDEIRKSVESRPDLDEGQKSALYNDEIRKWFEANKHRFPDWKLGDPLPDVEPSTNKRK